MTLKSITAICLLAIAACSSPPPKKQKKEQGKSDFVFRETLVKGDDTAMQKAGSGERVQLADVLCQHWELENMEGIESIDQVMDENNKRVFRELIFFTDSEVVENPRSHLRMGKWKAGIRDKKIVVTLSFPGKITKELMVQSIGPKKLLLLEQGKSDEFYSLELYSDGLRHQNSLNDPFHPSNNQWRIRPKKKENDRQLYERVKQCVKFYALYYRDNIKRNKDEISFLGLPTIFKWYRGGIGLPDRDKVDESWIECFYNKEQAMQGYQLLRDLIVDYEFNWDEKAPNWVYQTHSVLEQMYGKMK
jgi:hypothetical protein